MKKHFHSLIVLCAVIITSSAMSQSLQISYNSGTIPNGTIFHVWGDTLTGTISNPYPNPAINYTSFNYSFPKNTLHAQFVLRDILGSPVKEIDIGNREGKLLVNTSDIKSGIYFYSFYVDDKLILTKKLIVR